MERLTARSTAVARKCLLITRKIIIPPPDSGDPPDGPPYFGKKTFPPECWDPPATSSHARKCVRKKNDSPPDCWDPPATSSQASKCLTVGTHLVEAYVALSFWSRTCTYILVDVEACTCRSRGAHVACTRTYSDYFARKKTRPRTYIWVGSRTPTRAYVRPGLVYMAGSERRNCVVVVFMGRQPAGSERNASSCSSGGLGRNNRWKRGLAYRRTEETALCSTGHV